MRPSCVALLGLGAAACQVAGAENARDRGRAEVEVAEAPVLYPLDRTQSPITEDVAAHLVAIAALGPEQDDHWFAKIGDSITDTSSYLGCFTGKRVDLGDHEELDATLQHFLDGEQDGTTPFDRHSVAAVSGWAARGPLKGDPSPLEQELAAIAPRYATIMFGTNDVGYRSADQFGADLWTITDTLIARGVIPVLSTIPPRDASAEDEARVPLFDMVVRAIAQGRQVPLVDYNRELAALPDHGLIRDGTHPSRSPQGACALTDEGLLDGYNVRNLVTLEAFDRARRALVGEPAPDVWVSRRRGTGSHADPVQATLPFADLGDTRGGDDVLAGYGGCDATQDETGPEVVYQVELPSRITLEASVVDRDDIDVDVHILADSLEAAACLARGDNTATATVGPGTVHVVVDTYVDGSGGAHSGEYLLVLLGSPAP